MKKKKCLFYIMAISFILIFVLNILTPNLLADDFFYSLKFNSKEKIKNIFDIIVFQKNHYFLWGGRVLAHGVAQVFLLLPDLVFDFFNSLVFVLNGFLIYKIVLKKEDNALFLLVSYLMLWFLNPVFGEINLWVVGACNYLWTTCLCLTYIYLFENYKNNKTNNILICIVGFFSGMCNENTSLAIISMAILYYIVVDKKQYKYKKMSIFFAFLGYLFMILAPGNFVRLSGSKSTSFLFLIIQIFMGHFYYILFFFIFSTAIFIINKIVNDKKLYIYLFGIFISIFSIIFVPLTYLRNYYSTIIFAFIIILMILIKCNYRIIKIISIIIVSMFFINYSFTIKDFLYFSNFYNKRLDTLERASKNGVKEISLEQYYSNNSKIPLSVEFAEISYCEYHFPNSVIERYYNIDKIIGYKR